MQSSQKAGLYVYAISIFFESEISGNFLYGLWVGKTVKSSYKTSTSMFTYLYCNYCIISTIQDMARDIVRLRTSRQNRILRLSFPLFIIRSQKVDREKLSHRANLYRLVNTIIALMVNVIGLHEG